MFFKFRFLFAFVFVTFSASNLSPVMSQDAEATLSSSYFELADLYPALSFSVGPILEVKSPDPARYRNLNVASYNNKVRLGLLDDYDTTYGSQPQDTRQAKMAVTKRLAAEREVYLGLLAMHFGAEYFTAENLLFEDVDNQRAFFSIGSYLPRGYAGSLISNVAVDGVDTDYYCGKKPDCGNASGRLLYLFGPGPNLARARSWGGGQDEFSARTAVENFIETDLQALLAWSEDVPTEVAVVGSLPLPEYDFERGGFVFDVVIPSEAGPRSNELGFYYLERPTAEVKVLSDNGYTSTAFLSIAPAEAESLIEELKSTTRNTMIYFVVEGRFFNIDLQMPEARSNKSMLLYELTGSDISFYRDLSLTSKIGDSTLGVQ